MRQHYFSARYVFLRSWKEEGLYRKFYTFAEWRLFCCKPNYYPKLPFKMRKFLFPPLLLMLICCSALNATAETIKMDLRTRDIVTDEIFIKQVDIDPATTAIIIIDPWNSHWCMTASERVNSLVPRMNLVLDIARQTGMQIVWNPTDVVTMYAGWPQYEKSVAVKVQKAPHTRDIPSVKFTAPGGGCICGPGIQCRGNYGWDNINPDLVIGDQDLISASTDEIYSLLKERGIERIIYMGVHTNMCVFGKPGALGPMWAAGFDCMLARDINDALTSYFPDKGYTPDMGTIEIDNNLEQGGVPTVNMVEEFTRAGLLKTSEPYDMVRIAPWGKPERPYIMDQPIIVTLAQPMLPDAEIRYTTDGSEPTSKSTLYTAPFEVDESLTLRAAAFRKGKQVSVPSSAYYVKMQSELPAKPNVYLEELEYISNQYVNSGYEHCAWFPVAGKSFEGKKLRVRGEYYDHGMGFRAPASIQYQLKPEYKRFVARAGIDENMLDEDLGRFKAIHSSVIFRLLVDGELVAESPVMRITQEPWRFDVPIPAGSRLISLVCMDAGSRNILDYGNWLDAGFITE